MLRHMLTGYGQRWAVWRWSAKDGPPAVGIRVCHQELPQHIFIVIVLVFCGRL